jgi:hypothetical protein
LAGATRPDSATFSASAEDLHLSPQQVDSYRIQVPNEVDSGLAAMTRGGRAMARPGMTTFE